MVVLLLVGVIVVIHIILNILDRRQIIWSLLENVVVNRRCWPLHQWIKLMSWRTALCSRSKLNWRWARWMQILRLWLQSLLWLLTLIRGSQIVIRLRVYEIWVAYVSKFDVGEFLEILRRASLIRILSFLKLVFELHRTRHFNPASLNLPSNSDNYFIPWGGRWVQVILLVRFVLYFAKDVVHFIRAFTWTFKWSVVISRRAIITFLIILIRWDPIVVLVEDARRPLLILIMLTLLLELLLLLGVRMVIWGRIHLFTSATSAVDSRWL